MDHDADFAAARRFMVDGQLRPNRVSDRRILNAMMTLPRERFLPPELASRAYVDAEVPLGRGRVMPPPLLTARLIQLCAPAERDRAVVLGAGTGYGAAVLAACGCLVTAVEADPTLLAIARAALADLAPSVTLIEADWRAGFGGGIWDIVLVETALSEVAPELGPLLRARTGRFAAVVGGPGAGARAVAGSLTPNGLALTAEFDCALTPPADAQREQCFSF